MACCPKCCCVVVVLLQMAEPVVPAGHEEMPQSRLVGECMFCHRRFFVFEYAWVRVKECIDSGMCHECIAKRAAVAVGRHVKEAFHYELPCVVCGELFEVPFASRHLYGRQGEIFESTKGKLRAWLCDDCAEEALLKRAAKRTKQAEGDKEADVATGTPAN